MTSSEHLRSELNRAWSVLRTAERDPARLVVYPVVPAAGGPLRLHLSDDGHRHLLVPGRYSGVPIRGTSLIVGARRLVFDGVEHELLDVECTQPSLFDVFDELVVLIVERVANTDEPVAAAVAAIDDWRDLLRSGPAAPLSHERELGLYAELFVLSELTAAGAFDPAWWRGPLREPKDIVAPGAWIEVKGVGEHADAATVNGLDQLADIDGLAGYLAVVTVEPDPGGSAVDDLVALLAGRTSASEDFAERLRIAGWSSATPTGRKWNASRLDLVAVTECPRLVPESLARPPAPGIDRVRYDLDLATVRTRSLRSARARLHALGDPT